MKSFNFPLDRVLAWRQRQLEKEEAELQGMLGKLGLLEHRLANCRKEREAAGKPQPSGECAEGVELGTLGAYRERLLRFIEDFTRQIADLKRAIDKQRQAVMEARRRARLLERLKERRLQEWEMGFNKELEDFAGEAYLARWNAQQRPGSS